MSEDNKSSEGNKSSDERKASEEKKVAFKVVDRRRFTDEGDQRSGPDVPTSDPVRKDPPPAPPKEAAPAVGGEQGLEGFEGAAGVPPTAPAAGPDGGLNLSMFLQSLAQQGLMQMGLIPWPHGQRELALEQARDTVDILEMLKAKTRGNLTAEEQQLMDTVVYELKMSFVEVQQAIARSRAGIKPGGMPPPPGR